MTNTLTPEVTQKLFDFILLKLSEVRGGGRWRGVLRMNKPNGAAFFFCSKTFWIQTAFSCHQTWYMGINLETTVQCSVETHCCPLVPFPVGLCCPMQSHNMQLKQNMYFVLQHCVTHLVSSSGGKIYEKKTKKKPYKPFRKVLIKDCIIDCVSVYLECTC